LSKIYSILSPCEKCTYIFGWLLALIAGGIVPWFSFFMGDTFDAFDPAVASDANLAAGEDTTLDKLRELLWIFLGLSGGVWVFCYLYSAILISLAQSISEKTRKAYVEAIFKQECGWFDQSNYTELSSRLAREINAIEVGTGDKVGQAIMAVGMCLSGFAVGFTKGWSLTLVIMAALPPMMFVFSLWMTMAEKGAAANLRAYGQSSGYADQALSSIKTVTAFGMQ
jgi:ATP-binding cassette subfamily B (MDR/TAP) protein 1